MATPANTRSFPNQDGKLKIRIPKKAWNAFEPEIHEAASRTERSATRSSPRSNSDTEQEPDSEPPPRLDAALPRNCKVKLQSFHYGGPKRVTQGVFQNEVKYHAPCLQPTCTNCWTHHQHLMSRPTLPDEQNVFQPAPNPLSPPIDPGILDGSWRFDLPLQDSAESNPENEREAEEPRFPAFMQMPDAPVQARHDPPYHFAPLNRTYNILLPTSIVNQTVSGAPARTQWRSEPRRHTVRLAFVSREGKARFAELVKRKEKKDKRREYDRARRAKK
ncbi:hypothetical protein HBI56_157300 [Parastagonospora nodorum]|uniref:Uncharacterized protein n=1 Tax=Phaeosphaeria nodorum (strain SN15 / ATCC MYA-4574 / FGSC 10173) TaxID=321614 RepID=A0A7U2EWF0_PHANO|nr:hypothetical protein HBH56_188040 [Parastagonospora nodorum]QRC92209.1 hypothetical protein JI435_023490 [Parastagonospora nodorum SN15]KAH3925072.1 hypothetical protein HBH54_183850 [Parastagonospora nodorum]KAH3954323.1 hypothetical protein HBH53_023200 [Parastagonospora nodorum]KAH3963758.1 hypothetical protein HBH51_163030 [Parastagonospora nodorum]